MSHELPQGWVTARISELCDVPKEKGQEGVVPYLEIGNVDIRSKTYALTNKPSVKGCRIARKDDVLVSKVRPTRGAITWIREDKLHVSSAFAVLRNKGALAEKCLWQFLAWNRGYLNHLGENCTGTMYPTTSDDAIGDFGMPLAPLDEQRRVVAKLDTLLGKVDACQQRLAKIPVLLKRFRQSVLAAACSGRLTADWREERNESLEDWCDTRLAEVCSSVTDGDHLPPPKQSSGVPFLTIGNISSGRLDFSQTRHVSEDYFRRIKPDRIPKRGDVLYTVVGATIGIPVLVDIDRQFCFQRHIAILKPSERIESKFLFMLMGSPLVFREAWDRVTRSAQPTLPLGNLRPIPVRLPPLAEQQEIVRRVEGLFALADQIDERLAQARLQVDKLTPSLLARAFRGELLPQDPNDEPASELLERIGQQQNRAEKRARKKV